MQAVQSDTNQDLFNHLLDEARSLGKAELNAFVKALMNILPSQPPSELDEEKKLIEELKRHSPSKDFWIAYYELADKAAEKTLTKEERDHFSSMIERTQDWDIKRLQLSIKLSELWDIDLDKTMHIVNTILTPSTDAQ